MVEMQKKILKEYCQLNGWPSLREVSDDTGIQRTRVFRIMHGEEMRLGEYQIFKSKVLRRQREWDSHKKDLQEEIKDLLVLFLNQAFNHQQLILPKSRKVWLTPSEERILRGMLRNVDSFLDGVRDRKKRTDYSLKSDKRSLVYWGVLEC